MISDYLKLIRKITFKNKVESLKNYFLLTYKFLTISIYSMIIKYLKNVQFIQSKCFELPNK